MRTLTIGFSKPINKRLPLFSWFIRLLEWTPYSHVYLRWKSGRFEKDLVYQASGTTVHFLMGWRFDKKAETLDSFEIEMSEELHSLLVDKAMNYAGSDYGIKQVFGIAIVKLARLFNKDIKNPFADGESTWVCSEIVKELIEDLGISIPVHRDNVTPKDIYNILKEARDGNN